MDCDVVAEVQSNPQLFLVTGGSTPVQVICRILAEAGLGGTHVFVGEQLSYPEEKITQGTAAELALREFHPLSVMLCLRAQESEAEETPCDRSAGRPDGGNMPAAPATPPAGCTDAGDGTARR